MENKIREATEHHLLNIQYLKSNPNPSEKELKKMYGYLSYCFVCEKQFRFLEPFSHGFEGNCHKFGCSYLKRILGWIYNIFLLIFIKIPLLIIGSPYIIYYELNQWKKRTSKVS